MVEATFDLVAVLAAVVFVAYRLLSRRASFHRGGRVLSLVTLALVICVVIRSTIDLTGGTPTEEIVIAARLGAACAVTWFTFFMFVPRLLFRE